MGKKNTNKKKPFNIYAFMNKNRKKIIGYISTLIVLSLVIGLFAQFAY